IGAEKLEKLFDLEKESKKGTAGEKGTGLGLNLVKELLELNKGNISVKSELNQGSQFTIALPKMKVA
ncbi:MAG: ATP-binding protein, partial [Bacteroidota bacterium]